MSAAVRAMMKTAHATTLDPTPDDLRALRWLLGWRDFSSDRMIWLRVAAGGDQSGILPGSSGCAPGGASGRRPPAGLQSGCGARGGAVCGSIRREVHARCSAIGT